MTTCDMTEEILPCNAEGLIKHHRCSIRDRAPQRLSKSPAFAPIRVRSRKAACLLPLTTLAGAASELVQQWPIVAEYPGSTTRHWFESESPVAGLTIPLISVAASSNRILLSKHISERKPKTIRVLDRWHHDLSSLLDGEGNIADHEQRCNPQA